MAVYEPFLYGLAAEELEELLAVVVEEGLAEEEDTACVEDETEAGETLPEPPVADELAFPCVGVDRVDTEAALAACENAAAAAAAWRAGPSVRIYPVAYTATMTAPLSAMSRLAPAFLLCLRHGGCALDPDISPPRRLHGLSTVMILSGSTDGCMTPYPRRC